MVRNSGNAIAAADRIERVENAKAAEAQRLAVAKLEKAKAMRGRLKDELVHEGGHSFMRKRISTTVDRLVASGKIDKGLKGTLDVFARLMAEAAGAATLDGDDATNRLTGGYEPGGSGGFGPRSISERTLNAEALVHRIHSMIPRRLVRTFLEIACEEVGALAGRPRTLAQVGAERGYASEKQASASGGTEIAVLVELIDHLIRQFGAIDRESRPRSAMREERHKILTHQLVLEEAAA